MKRPKNDDDDDDDDDDDAPVIVMEAPVVDEAQMVEFHAPDADSSSVHDSPQSASLQSIARALCRSSRRGAFCSRHRRAGRRR
jgi:hypothetical protein